MVSPQGDSNSYGALPDVNWSPAEKRIARRAFALALRRELEMVVRETKRRAEKNREPADLWDLELYLTKRRQQIDREFDYRSSVSILVFGNLIRQGKLREEELRSLSDDKLDSIRRYADFQFSLSSKQET